MSFQAAINYAVSSGISAIAFTPGKTYSVTQTSGTLPLPWDNGVCPTGSTVNGSPCANLAAEVPVQQSYSLWIPGSMTVYGNGATINGGWNIASSPSNANQPATILCTSSLTVINDG